MDNLNEEVGSVKVHISKKEVHKAVQNILKNEMNLDIAEIKNEIHQKAHELIKKEVIDHIGKSGYGSAELESWAKRAMDARAKEVNTVLKEVVKELVHKHIHDEIVEVVEAVIKNGMEIRLGWKNKIKLKMEN